MAGNLLVVAGPDQGQVFPLEEGAKVVIGRGDTANFRVTDPAVSRAHCVIECSSGKAVLKDSGSKTGTRVNGRTITEHQLAPDEVLQVGTTKIRFQWTAPPPKAAADEAEDDSEEIQKLRALTGDKLGHFEIGPEVGFGSNGVVFRAKDLKEDREIALKVYKPEFAKHEEDLHRFIRAVKTMLPMRHQNLVILYGGGKIGPHCWMAMEFVEGENLEETIARIGKGGKLDWRPALRVALDICRGLFYIHGENIIHRGLAPRKILFSRTGTAKLGSLILAKALSGALAQDVTTGGAFLSDVRFLSPEQVSEVGTVDVRSDLYCLGALVYALLTGTPPFNESTPIQTVYAILERDPKPPRTIDPHIPAPLERSVMRLLARKPEDRYQSAADLLTDLEQIPKT